VPANTVLEDYPCYRIKSTEISCESIELFQLGSFQSFGVAFPVKDDESFDMYEEITRTTQADFVREKINYTAITEINTELYKFDLEQFLQIVTDANLATFRKSLTTMQADGQYRQAFLTKQ